jgi:multidrug transporter EmrE-like cation transporter
VTHLAVVGLEAVLAFLFGVVVFSESCGPARIAGVLLITLGILSLRSAL